MAGGATCATTGGGTLATGADGTLATGGGGNWATATGGALRNVCGFVSCTADVGFGPRIAPSTIWAPGVGSRSARCEMTYAVSRNAIETTLPMA